MRTNIEIDDTLMARAMEVLGARTKREAVELALQKVVGNDERLKQQKKAFEQLRGLDPDWAGDLANIPFDEWPDWSKRLKHDTERYAELKAKAERLMSTRKHDRAA